MSLSQFYPTSEQSEAKLAPWLAEQTGKSTLRFLTCGSVDDGKSTLIGRLLYDSQLILDDQLLSLKKESTNRTTGAEGIDFSLLVDGLQAEREQGITIDVAYRFFTTKNRKFIVADTPGHEQYTRNMATGASRADLAIILVDARKGLLTQTRRHTFILSLLGVKHVVMVVNKIDLMNHDQHVFDNLAADYGAFAEPLGFKTLVSIPISALNGDNVVSRSARMDWYKGPQLLPYLETIDVSENVETAQFRFPVQWVNRASLDFRGFSGTIASGTVKLGDEVLVASSRKGSKIKSIVTMDGDLDEAVANQAVTLTLEDEIDISRGDILLHQGQMPQYCDQFQANVIWMHEDKMYSGRSYVLKAGTQQVPVNITSLKHQVNVNSLETQAARSLELNQVGVVTLATERPIAFDRYVQNHKTGSFILIDRLTNATVGAGMICHMLSRAQNLTYQAFDVTRKSRAQLMGHKSFIVWFSGLSGSGKSTVANLVEKRLNAEGKHVYVLDGDNVRHGLNKDLGFRQADRIENIRRVAEVARLMADAGLIVLVSFISPFERERAMAREIAGDIGFIEAYVNTPFEVCEQRDPKGLYARARKGEIKNFTGLDSPFEAPENPDIVLKGALDSPQEMADTLYDKLINLLRK